MSKKKRKDDQPDPDDYEKDDLNDINNDDIDIYVDLEDDEKENKNNQIIEIPISNLENIIGKYSFNDIGGLAKAKNEMKHYAMGLANEELYKQYGIKPSRGLLFVSEPGMGKTLCAKVLASEIGNYVPEEKKDTTYVFFDAIGMENFASKYIGETTNKLKKYFEDRKIAADKLDKFGIDVKYIFFLDEAENILSNRDDTHEAYSKAQNVLLKIMDGIEENKHFYFFAATNMPDRIDPAFMRAGRLDKVIKIDNYNVEDLVDIYKIHMNKMDERSEFKNMFSPDINYNKIAKESEGFNGAEVAEICRRCGEYALYRHIERNEFKIPLQTKHILKEIELHKKNRPDVKKLSADYKKSKIGFDPKK